MSYILEALRKAERDRQLSEAPSVPEVLSMPPAHQRNGLLWLAVLLLLVINGGLVWHFWGKGKQDVKPPETVPAPGQSRKPVEQPSPKAENPAAVINPVKHQTLPSVNPGGPSGNVEAPPATGLGKPMAKAWPAPLPYPANPPIPALEPRKAAAGKSGPMMLPPGLGDSGGKPLAGRASDHAEQTLGGEPKPLIDKDRLASVKTLTRQPGGGQTEEIEYIPVKPQPEMPHGSNANFKINVLAYSNKPEERFAVINMVKYSRGERLPSGEILQDIEANGIVLEANGKRFRVANH